MTCREIRTSFIYPMTWLDMTLNWTVCRVKIHNTNSTNDLYISSVQCMAVTSITLVKTWNESNWCGSRDCESFTYKFNNIPFYRTCSWVASIGSIKETFSAERFYQLMCHTQPLTPPKSNEWLLMTELIFKSVSI